MGLVEDPAYQKDLQRAGANLGSEIAQWKASAELRIKRGAAAMAFGGGKNPVLVFGSTLYGAKEVAMGVLEHPYTAGALVAVETGPRLALKAPELVLAASRQASTLRLLENAELALADELVALAGRSGRYRANVSTMVGAVDLRTGKTAVGRAMRGLEGCAEADAAAQLGFQTDILFTPAVRPRTGKVIPVCKTCQSQFSRSQFSPAATFE